MRCVREPASHDPQPGAPRIEECSFGLPPFVVLFQKCREPLRSRSRICVHKRQPRFNLWERLDDLNLEHGSEPGVLTGALMDHMLQQTAAAAVLRMWAA